MGARLTRRASGRLDRRTARPPQTAFLVVNLTVEHPISVARIIGFVAIAHAMEQSATVLEKGCQEGIQVPQRLRVVRSVGLEGLQDMRAARGLQKRLQGQRRITVKLEADPAVIGRQQWLPRKLGQSRHTSADLTIAYRID